MLILSPPASPACKCSGCRLWPLALQIKQTHRSQASKATATPHVVSSDPIIKIKNQTTEHENVEKEEKGQSLQLEMKRKPEEQASASRAGLQVGRDFIRVLNTYWKSLSRDS